MTQVLRAPWLISFWLLVSGCAAMQQAHEKAIDDSLALTYGADLSQYRRVLVDRLTCQGDLCDPAVMENLTGLLSQGMIENCYTLINPQDYSRYARHFARRMGDRGATFSIQGPGGGMIAFESLTPDLRAVLAQELDIDAVLSGHVQIGTPDDITGFRVGTLNLTLTRAGTAEVGWRSRMQGNIHEPSTLSQSLESVAQDALEGVRRKASVCALPAQVASQEYDDIQLVDQQIRLRQKIYFQLDSHELDPRSNAVLDRLASYLIAHPELGHIRISGHTDDVGDDTYNQKLSERRAASVAQYLISRGVPAARLEAVGYGESRPIVPNDSEAHRARNRRVEFEMQ